MIRTIRKKRRIKPIWKLIFFIIVIVIVVQVVKDLTREHKNNTVQTSPKVLMSDNKENLELEEKILGQKKIEDADGYTTEFTTLNKNNSKTYKEYKQNGNSSWSQNPYWGGTMEENGCGITSIAIIASGYNLEVTPENLRQQYYPHLDTENISQALQALNINCTDFYFHSSYISNKYITEWLETGRPILICVDNKKENVWTKASHYMVLLDVDKNGLIYVSNPNGEEETEKESGWYEPDEVIPYIVKALFIESY